MWQYVFAFFRCFGTQARLNRCYVADYTRLISFSINVSRNGCYRSVLNQCGFILNDCEQRPCAVINQSEQKKALLSITSVYVIDPLQVGTQAVGDVGALIWVAEQLDLIGHIDRACGDLGARGGPSVGEVAGAVIIQLACSPGPKRDLAEYLDGAVPRLSCLPSSAFSGQTYHRVARQVTDEQLEQAQIAIANAAVARFELSADVLAFD